MIIRYINGVQKLDEASEQVIDLQKDLEIKQGEVNTESNEVQELLKQINEKKTIAERETASATEKKKKLDIDSIEINKSQKEADKILQDAIPLLE